MKPVVYIETTIPRFYYEIRVEPEMVSRKNWTREWWKSFSDQYHLVTGEGVIAELEEGDYESRDDAIELLRGIEVLDAPDEIADIINVYLENHLMPQARLGDALVMEDTT